MSVCVSVSPICATNQELNLNSLLVLCLHMKITTCLLILINQYRELDNFFPCELLSSFSADELFGTKFPFLYDSHGLSLVFFVKWQYLYHLTIMKLQF